MPECIDADECCCICLGTLAKERCTRQACGHHFHIKCLRENLRFSLECPLCRALWHDIAVVRMRSAPAAKQSIEDFALLLDRVCPAKKKTRTQYILHRDAWPGSEEHSKTRTTPRRGSASGHDTQILVRVACAM
eukprot:6212461-Pleurochrysis_carterae.AAC.1